MTATYWATEHFLFPAASCGIESKTRSLSPEGKCESQRKPQSMDRSTVLVVRVFGGLFLGELADPAFFQDRFKRR